MYYLVAESIRDRIEQSGTRYAMYNMHKSGTSGLIFFKERMGFAPFRIDWRRGDETEAELAERERRARERAGRTQAAPDTAATPTAPARGQSRDARRSAGLTRRIVRRGVREVRRLSERLPGRSA